MEAIPCSVLLSRSMPVWARVRILLSDFFFPTAHNPPDHHAHLKFSHESEQTFGPRCSNNELFETWLASRSSSGRGEYLGPGAHRPLGKSSLNLAYKIMRLCAIDLFSLLWALHPWRTLLMVSLEFIRGIFPAFRGYSQALLINELQALISAGKFTWARLATLVVTEFVRVGLETLVDSDVQ